MYVESVNLEIGTLQGFELGTFQVSPHGQVVASVTLNGEEVKNVVVAETFSLPLECVAQIKSLIMAEVSKKYNL